MYCAVVLFKCHTIGMQNNLYDFIIVFDFALISLGLLYVVHQAISFGPRKLSFILTLFLTRSELAFK